MARKNDRLLRRHVPRHLVSDPSNEIEGSHQLEGLLDEIREAKGEEAVEEMTAMIAERFRSLSMHTRSFVSYMLDRTGR